MKRLAVLYPPCGAEFEYYLHGERIRPRIHVNLMGARYHGGDDEHEPRHMRKTASIENLLQAADVMRPLQPDAIMWACTSGSFISGLSHAHEQATAMHERLRCAASSTSLAFISALGQLGLKRASVLGSYLEETTVAFTSFLAEAGIQVCDYCALEAPSGPHAARFGDERLMEAAARLVVPEDGALLIPDTAMPTMHLVNRLEAAMARPVLTANQVSLWEGARLLGIDARLDGLGRLFNTEANHS